MAGRRLTAGRRGPDGRIRAVALVERANRIREAARARYAAAQTDAERLAAAVDYVRAAAAAADRAGLAEAGAVRAEATRTLMAVGDTITGRLARQGRAA
ncbi:hypothetical protein [Pseudonocardia nigra]|uniref:hypothetical protein n=1 Tax=Pseudonocardia nigra TaxID=1921578 RepID=UPI001C5DEC8F|nr:hypothetical protein [Pseudonocardia nigra]